MPPETLNLPLITREAWLRLVRGEGDDMTIDVIWTTGAGLPPSCPLQCTTDIAPTISKCGTSRCPTRGAISQMTGREVSRDLIARLHRQALIARGPRSPEPGAPYTYVTTPGFLQLFGLKTPRNLPDLEALEDSGLLAQDAQIVFDLPVSGEDD